MRRFLCTKFDVVWMKIFFNKEKIRVLPFSGLGHRDVISPSPLFIEIDGWHSNAIVA